MLDRLPKVDELSTEAESRPLWNSSFQEYLSERKGECSTGVQRKKRLTVAPGSSVCVDDFMLPSPESKQEESSSDESDNSDKVDDVLPVALQKPGHV